MRPIMAAAAAAIMMSLAGAPAAAQEASSDPTAREVLYAIEVPAAAIPVGLVKVPVDEWTIAPGVDAAITLGNEAIRGRGCLVRRGTIEVRPVTDALVWRAADAIDGQPGTTPAGGAVTLGAGDVILLPAIPTAEADPTQAVGLANPGTDAAIVFCFHLHQPGGAFSGWPDGITSTAGVTYSDPEDMQATEAAGAVFRLSRLSLPAGSQATLPTDAAYAIYIADEGSVRPSTGGAPAAVGGGTWLSARTDPPVSIETVGDGPAVLLELAVIPSLGETPAASPGPSVGVAGSIWREGSAASGTYHVLHSDGTVVSYSRRMGIGIGLWRPSGASSLSLSTVFSKARPGSTTYRGGSSSHRSEWTIDPSGETAMASEVVTVRPVDGAAAPPETGTLTLTRLHLAPMPPDAAAPTPAEPSWTPELGRAIYLDTRPAQFGVASEPWDPPVFNLTNADGTAISINTFIGDGVLLWAPTGATTSVATGWYPGWHSDPPAVAESESDANGDTHSRFGTSLAFEGESSATIMRVLQLTGDPLVTSPDGAAWPALGTVWEEAISDGLTVRTAFMADGTIVSVHPLYGEGVGVWWPTGTDTLVSTIHYTADYFIVRGESTVGPDGETLETRYVVAMKDHGEESGISTGTRMVEPGSNGSEHQAASPAP